VLVLMQAFLLFFLVGSRVKLKGDDACILVMGEKNKRKNRVPPQWLHAS
jgi:hypothetical protein